MYPKLQSISCIQDKQLLMANAAILLTCVFIYDEYLPEE